jgi:hypothetical protein
MDLERIVSEIKKEVSLFGDIEGVVLFINQLRREIHELSPFKNEPIDFVIWKKSDSVVSNDYNPNKVAPPEMKLLEISIDNDGYTQPIVAWNSGQSDNVEVVDGFHRTRVGKESTEIKNRIFGYLPIVEIRTSQSDKNNRIASTIRHNRARGKHQISAMSEIVIELKNRNWSNERISKQLGMDEEEVLRLCQISGLENLFSDSDFSLAWESSDTDDNFTVFDDDIPDSCLSKYKIPNENDDTRIFHTYDKWECYKSGFYANKKEGYSDEWCNNEYVRILTNEELFSSTLEKVIVEWKHSCEHYLTNSSMNRIAWLGQAAVCYESGVPASYCGAFNLLSDEQKKSANIIAKKYLDIWCESNNVPAPSDEEANAIGRQVELY